MGRFLKLDECLFIYCILIFTLTILSSSYFNQIEWWMARNQHQRWVKRSATSRNEMDRNICGDDPSLSQFKSIAEALKSIMSVSNQDCGSWVKTFFHFYYEKRIFLNLSELRILESGCWASFFIPLLSSSSILTHCLTI